MNTAGSVFTGLTLASIITTGGLTLNLTENFGNLADNGSVKQEVDSGRLVGSYGNAVTGMSAVVIGLSAIFLVFFTFGWYRKRKNKEARGQYVYWVFLLLAVVLGICSAGVNLGLTENYGSLDSITPDPDPPVAGENYKLRGPYGNATLGMAATSLGVAGIALIWMMGMYFQHLTHRKKYKLDDDSKNKRRQLDFSVL